MKALCFAEGHRYQVWELIWTQYYQSISNAIRDIAVSNVAKPADGIAVLPSVSRRLELWESFQLWHTRDDVGDLQWLPCFYDLATPAPWPIPNTVKITNIFHSRVAAQPVQRLAQDGTAYTCGEFIHWCGTQLGRQRWLEAESENEQRLKEILRKAFPSSSNDEECNSQVQCD